MTEVFEAGSSVPKNRYAQAPRHADWTIDQNWPSYTAEEHDRWNRLFARQAKLLPGRACGRFLAAKQSSNCRARAFPTSRS